MRKNLLSLLRGNASQQQMAQKYGVSQQTWSSWEKGRTRPELGVMLKLQEDYDVPIAVIFFTATKEKGVVERKMAQPSNAPLTKKKEKEKEENK